MTRFTDDEVDASNGEYLAVGLMGICMITGLGAVTLWNVHRGMKPGTELFFLCILCMCLLEYPRYFTMAIYNSYDSKVGYR